VRIVSQFPRRQGNPLSARRAFEVVRAAAGQQPLLYPLLLYPPLLYPPLLFSRALELWIFSKALGFSQRLPQAVQAAEAAPKRWLLQAAGTSQLHEATLVDALVTSDYNYA